MDKGTPLNHNILRLNLFFKSLIFGLILKKNWVKIRLYDKNLRRKAMVNDSNPRSRTLKNSINYCFNVVKSL